MIFTAGDRSVDCRFCRVVVGHSRMYLHRWNQSSGMHQRYM